MCGVLKYTPTTIATDVTKAMALWRFSMKVYLSAELTVVLMKPVGTGTACRGQQPFTYH
ncbi:hypothetical protein SDC9_182743 [bioreactor metagenome]|uniref:Uncharacterized protein n=1 Tax=bioreactor metagenome TaxID=1076179 RepID=A0A645H9P6_9ZZZZ